MTRIQHRQRLTATLLALMLLAGQTAGCGRDQEAKQSNGSSKNDKPADPSVDSADKRENSEDSKEPGAAVEVVAATLDTPCGVAVQPTTGHVFVSLKDRIVRIVPGEDVAIHDEIANFPTDAYGRGPIYHFGPLGLAFWDAHTLVVGGGGQKDGKDVVRFFEIGDTPRSQPSDAQQAKFVAGPIPRGDDSIRGEGNYFGIVVRPPNIFVTANGDDTKGWICRIRMDADGPQKLEPFIKSKHLTQRDGPTGATFTPDGELLVAQIGELNTFPDSLLAVYESNAQPAKLHQYTTDRRDLTAVAYSPKTGRLYGLDFSWAAPKEGGLFLLVLNGDGKRAQSEKILDLLRPSAMAFAADGTLWVTAIGSIKDNRPEQKGQLLRVRGL